MKESRTITLDAQGLYFRFFHHLSVKNKLKCTETCWSKEKVQSSFKGEEKKKNKETLRPGFSRKRQLQSYTTPYLRSQSERTHFWEERSLNR